MIKAIIVDDEKKFTDSLNQMINENFHDRVHIIAKSKSVKEAVHAIKIHDPDLVFLDIEMPPGNGFQVLEQIENKKFEVVFTTAYEEYGAKAFSHPALHYLLKPIDPTELEIAINRYRAAVGRTAGEGKEETFMLNKLALPTQSGTVFVDFDDVVRIQSANKFSVVSTRDKKQYIVSKPLSRFEEVLDGKGFFRVHDSHLINLSHLKKYVREGKTGEIILSDDSKVPVSSRRKDAVNAIFKNLL